MTSDPTHPSGPVDRTAAVTTDADSSPGDTEHLGRRIATRRVELGLTQQALASRIAISRVALSNLESGRSMPGERTVTLLAGIFGTEPWELVEGTNYPSAKVDRLPLVAARHTEVELQLALLERDRTWLESAPAGMARDVVARWRRELAELDRVSHDPVQRAKVRAALDSLR